jgi:hypothetical protein
MLGVDQTVMEVVHLEASAPVREAGGVDLAALATSNSDLGGPRSTGIGRTGDPYSVCCSGD